MIALGANGGDLHSGAALPLTHNDRPSREVKGYAQHVGVFHVEHAVFVQFVGLAAQRATDDLFAQQLRSEGTNAQDVGHRVGVPALGEHGHRDDAADICSQAAFLTDRVHDLAQQVRIIDVVRGPDVAGTLDYLPPKSLDLRCGGISELVAELLS